MGRRTGISLLRFPILRRRPSPIPVRSESLTTKGSKSIRYGKVEVVAKFPEGDWLWLAIWVKPVNDAYGVWPASGEIDIIKSRQKILTIPWEEFIRFQVRCIRVIASLD